MFRYNRLGLLAIVGLVVLRCLVGFHFYMEGAAKVQQGNFSSAGFLSGAVGPLSPMFKGMLDDYDGRLRTDADAVNERLERFVERAKSHYRYDEEQQKTADEYLAASQSNIEAAFGDWEQEIYQYESGFDRVEELQSDPSRTSVASLAAQRESIEAKWRSEIQPFLKEIDMTVDLLEGSLASLATDDARDTAGVLRMSWAEEPPMMHQSTIDRIIPIFDMVVGILLFIGLLTPLAGIAAGIFLVSVVLTQFPGTPGAQPTYYQAIEAAACFLLAFADAGRYAGLDFIPWTMWQRWRAKRAARRLGVDHRGRKIGDNKTRVAAAT